MRRPPIIWPVLALLACACTTHAQIALPNDFESPGAAFSPLFSYGGGVASFGATPSATTVYSGASLDCSANLVHPPFFRVVGFSVGSYLIARPHLSVPAAPTHFSITVKSDLPAGKVMSMLITLREDDDNNGLIEVLDADDEWEPALPVMLAPGINTYNLPLSAFELTNPGAGNGLQNFTTTQRMGVLITFETRGSYPGGLVEIPVSFGIDHAGIYAAAQIPPPPPMCAADFNQIGGVTIDDLFAFLNAWFSGLPGADFNHLGGVTIDDLFLFLNAWFVGC